MEKTSLCKSLWKDHGKPYGKGEAYAKVYGKQRVYAKIMEKLWKSYGKHHAYAKAMESFCNLLKNTLMP